jgi:hypothetical protein
MTPARHSRYMLASGRDLPMKLLTTLKVVATCLVALVAFDLLVARPLLGLGMRAHYAEENLLRSPAPYVGFTGKPGALDHDRWGYRKMPPGGGTDALRIAFFGGSTGYNGDPPIAALLQQRLAARIGAAVTVSNFSVVSSKHRQHLHNLIETRAIFAPDLVVFYGGYNELQTGEAYDPRPGYPYNFFFREETSALVRALFEYSAIFGLVNRLAERHFGASATPLMRLRAEYRPMSPEWKRAVVDKYFETLEYARTVAGAFPSARCGKTQFFAFYQPYQVTEKFADGHREVRRRIAELAYGADVSGALDDFGKAVYTDVVHITQAGNERIADAIADAIVHRNALAPCTLPNR